MHSDLICLNCSQPLLKADRYCRTCGQKTDTQRFTVKKIFQEFVHSLTHADRNVFGLIKNLLFNPGITAREYVQGKRKAHFNPFIFLLLCMAVFVFLNSYLKALGPLPEIDQNYLERLGSEAARNEYLRKVNKQAGALAFIQKHSNILGILAVPFFSLFTWFLIRKGNWNYVEHIVGNIMFIAFANLAFTLTITPLMAAFSGSAVYFIFLVLGLFLQSIYLGWAQFQFNGSPGTGYFFYCFFIGLVATACWGIFTQSVLMLYVNS